MTFADYATKLDQAIAPILAILDKSGPQWMAAPGDAVWVYVRDNGPLGFRVMVASKASETGLSPVLPPLSPAPSPVLAAAVS